MTTVARLLSPLHKEACIDLHCYWLRAELVLVCCIKFKLVCMPTRNTEVECTCHIAFATFCNLCAGLQQLSATLCNWCPTDQPLASALSRLNKLTELKLANSQSLQNQELAGLLPHLTALQRLDLAECYKLTEGGIRNLEFPLHLTALNLSR